MKFFSRELSQALQEAGCIGSGWFWIGMEPQYRPDWRFDDFTESEKKAYPQIFHPWDLCGPSQIARENAKKVWGEEGHVLIQTIPASEDDKGRGIDFYNIYKKQGEGWKFHLYALIDLPSHEEQEKYILETLKNGKK